MNKIISALCLFTLIAIGMNSCVNGELLEGKGESVTKSIVMDKTFNRVISDIGFDIEVNPMNNDNKSVTMIGQQNIIDLVSLAVADSELVIKFKKDVNIVNATPRKIVLNVPQIRSLKVLGDGNAVINNGLITEQLKLNVMGNGSIQCKQATIGKLDCGVSGNGNMNFEECTSQDAAYALSGNGDIKAFGNLSRNVMATVTGNGSIDANIVNNLDATVTGNGSINYKGNPNITRQIVSGNGTIEKQ